MGEAILKTLAKKHNKSEAQILLRWSLQMVRKTTGVEEVHSDIFRGLSHFRNQLHFQGSKRTRICTILSYRSKI